MLEIKVKKNSVYQRISGSPDTVLTEAAMMVCAIVRNVVRGLREKGMTDEDTANLHTAINLMLLDSIGNGIAEGKEKSE